MDQMSLAKQNYLKNRTRINYLLAKYELKGKQENLIHSTLPEPDQSNYLDEDPNFLPFYGIT